MKSLIQAAAACATLTTLGAQLPAVDAQAGVDRTFHPDFSHALSVDQMERAWQAELDRINPPTVTGGG